MFYKVLNKKYVDISKIVGIELDSYYEDGLMDTLVIDIQLMDKPLIIQHPEITFKVTTVDIHKEITEELDKILKLINKPVTTTNEQSLYNVKVNETIFELDYEEMVEIFTVYRHKLKGNEGYESAMKKAKEIFEHLPVTDY